MRPPIVSTTIASSLACASTVFGVVQVRVPVS
jgi:hypothetical protein